MTPYRSAEIDGRWSTVGQAAFIENTQREDTKRKKAVVKLLLEVDLSRADA